MSPRHSQLDRIENVAPGRTALIHIDPLGELYEVNLRVQATAGNLTDIIDDMRLVVSDKEYRVHSASQLDQIQAQYGAEFGAVNLGAGNLIQFGIFLWNPWRKEYADQRAPALGTADLNKDKMRLEVDIKAGANADVTLEASQVWVPSNKTFYGNPFIQFDRTPVNISGGRDSFQNFELDGALQELNLFDDPTDHSTIEISLDKETFFDKITVAENNAFLKRCGYTVDADFLTFAFDRMDRTSEALPLAVRTQAGAKLTARNLKMAFVTADPTERNPDMIIQRWMPAGGV